eukprot:20579-Heterococcus_DN1.PRE.3
MHNCCTAHASSHVCAGGACSGVDRAYTMIKRSLSGQKASLLLRASDVAAVTAAEMHSKQGAAYGMLYDERCLPHRVTLLLLPLLTIMSAVGANVPYIRSHLRNEQWRSQSAAEPDAWIWLGDMAYLDYPSVNCAVLPQDAQCNCADEITAFKAPPFCLSGDEQHSLLKHVGHRASVRVYSLSNCSHQCNSSNRVSVLNSLHTPQSYILYCCTTPTTQTCNQQQYQTMLHNTEYRAFLDYMCPGAAAKGLFPPPGSNPSVCPR